MSFIKVWCEYDIGGSLGGNNDMEVFDVADKSQQEIEKLLEERYEHLRRELELEEDESLCDSGLFDWEFFDIGKLGE